MHNIADKKLLMLRPCDIITTGNTPRQFFDPDEIKLLSRSVSANGIIHPLAVRKAYRGKYVLITGERRLRAAKMAGLRRIPCILYKLDEQTAEIYSLVENIHSKRLSFFEEARFINALIVERGMSEAEVSLRLGMTQSAISLKLKLLRLDRATQQKISEYSLTEQHARALLKLPESRREFIADIFFKEHIHPDDAEQVVNEILNPVKKKHIKNNESEVLPANEIVEKPIITPQSPPAKDRKYDNLQQTTKASIGDIRLFENSLYKLSETLSSAGVRSGIKTTETAKYIEYRIRVNKSDTTLERFKQLKIC
ncbi:MAG: ParB/RepB/Spo0J family partition protein [Ruminococcaceae bacterium]|nr:ParB/RepB/Spo0J family partition protein [Oscillospiraceae bacterium]